MGLDKAAVVRTAAALADSEGLEAVTLARLAAELGIRSPSLYNHVAGPGGIRHELALYGVRELRRRLERAAVGRAGDDALRVVAHAYRAFAQERPGLYAATLRAPDAGDADLVAASADLLAVITAIFAGYGLTGDAALHATRALRSITHGFVALEAAGGFGLPLDLDASYGWLVDTFIAGLRAAHPQGLP